MADTFLLTNYSLLALAQQQLADAKEFYESQPNNAQWMIRVIGEVPNKGVFAYETSFDPNNRDRFYNTVEAVLRANGVERYAAAAEAWSGGAKNPNRVEVFMIAAADRVGNRLGMYFTINRSGPHAVLVPHSSSHTDCVGDMFAMLD